MLGQALKFHPLGRQRVQQGDEVAQVAAQTIQLPHDQGLSGFERLETPGEGRTLHRGA
jgi:hypothetical protein